MESGASEEFHDACLGGADEISKFFETEVGIGVRQTFFKMRLNDGHQLVVVAQVGFLEQFLVAYDEVFEHFDATADVIVGVDHLAELHIAVDEVHVGLLKHFHLPLQFLNPGFVVFIAHIVVALLVQR